MILMCKYLSDRVYLTWTPLSLEMILVVKTLSIHKNIQLKLKLILINFTILFSLVSYKLSLLDASYTMCMYICQYIWLLLDKKVKVKNNFFLVLCTINLHLFAVKYCKKGCEDVIYFLKVIYMYLSRDQIKVRCFSSPFYLLLH